MNSMAKPNTSLKCLVQVLLQALKVTTVLQPLHAEIWRQTDPPHSLSIISILSSTFFIAAAKSLGLHETKFFFIFDSGFPTRLTECASGLSPKGRVQIQFKSCAFNFNSCCISSCPKCIDHLVLTACEPETGLDDEIT
jgi:hypothetical protein